MNKQFHSEILAIIKDARDKNFSYIDTIDVPSAYNVDSNLTYESGSIKKGKKISTCVLYVDIRNSVDLIKTHRFDTMGKIYTAFAKSILKIAHFHGGKVRNIIGDRVMVVFPSENCFTQAVNCAISINHTAEEINRIFDHVNFKCGIGVDYGEMRVIKVGTEKKGDENANYKNLIWVGHPANHASRLTDVANKSIDFITVKLKLKRWNFTKYLSKSSQLSGLGIVNNDDEYIYENKILLESEFIRDLKIAKDGKVKYHFSEVIEYERIVEPIKYGAILLSKKVYENYKKENTESNDIIDDLWVLQPKGVKNINEEIYGSGLTWEIK